MGFLYPVCMREEVDIDELIYKWNQSPDIVNHMHKFLTNGEYALINFIINQGLQDIRGQEPGIDLPIDDDPFAKPNPDWGISNPWLNPEDPDDNDPFARPIVVSPESGNSDIETE